MFRRRPVLSRRPPNRLLPAGTPAGPTRRIRSRRVFRGRLAPTVGEQFTQRGRGRRGLLAPRDLSCSRLRRSTPPGVAMSTTGAPSAGPAWVTKLSGNDQSPPVAHRHLVCPIHHTSVPLDGFGWDMFRGHAASLRLPFHDRRQCPGLPVGDHWNSQTCWQHLVADGKPAELSQPSPANQTRAFPLPVEPATTPPCPGPSLPVPVSLLGSPGRSRHRQAVGLRQLKAFAGNSWLTAASGYRNAGWSSDGGTKPGNQPGGLRSPWIPSHENGLRHDAGSGG